MRFRMIVAAVLVMAFVPAAGPRLAGGPVPAGAQARPDSTGAPHTSGDAGATAPSSPGATAQVPSTAPTGAVPSTATLMVGDAAPAITIDTWVKGAPVPHLKKGQTYVVEFWATWCGPCKQSIPHLTEVQKQFRNKNVTIIGISSEQKGLDVIRPFVDGMGDKMNYTVAFDKNMETYNAWMSAAGQNGIPTAFVVNGQGQVAWIGHPVYPQGELERVLDEVSSGKYDLRAAAEQAHALQSAQQKLRAAAAASDTAAVLAGLDELITLDKPRADEYAVQKLNILLFVIKDYDAGYKYVGRLVDENFKDNAQMLNAIAFGIVDSTASPGLGRRDLDAALRAASRANELTAGKDPQVLDTLALITFRKGDAAKAVELETAALGLAADDKTKADFQTRLDKYKAGLEKK